MTMAQPWESHVMIGRKDTIESDEESNHEDGREKAEILSLVIPENITTLKMVGCAISNPMAQLEEKKRQHLESKRA